LNPKIVLGRLARSFGAAPCDSRGSLRAIWGTRSLADAAIPGGQEGRLRFRGFKLK
jgi:hypothetical protein